MIKTSLRSFGQFSRSSFKFEDSLVSVFKEREIQTFIYTLNAFTFIFPATAIMIFGLTSEAISFTTNSAFFYVLNNFLTAYKTKDILIQLKVSEDGKKLYLRKISNPRNELEYSIKDVQEDKSEESKGSNYFSLYRFKIKDSSFIIPKSAEIVDNALLESILNGEEVDWLDD